MSLTSPHPIYRTAGYAPNKVSMAIVQALMLSGRYRCDSLVCKWSKKITGYCTLSPSCANILEDLDHILRICPALSATRNRLRDFTHSYSQSLPAPVRNVLLQYCNPENDDYCQFLLDSSGFAEVVLFRQDFGSEILESIFTVTRTWAYLLHRERLKLRGQWRSGPNWLKIDWRRPLRIFINLDFNSSFYPCLHLQPRLEWHYFGQPHHFAAGFEKPCIGYHLAG